MALEKVKLLEFIFRRGRVHRFTQDSPVLPDVWIAYADQERDAHIDLILSPMNEVAPGATLKRIVEALARNHEAHEDDHELLYNQMDVVGRFAFSELISTIIPLTAWWRRQPSRVFEMGPFKAARRIIDELSEHREKEAVPQEIWDRYGQFLQLVLVAGLVALCRARESEQANARLDDLLRGARVDDCLELVEEFLTIMGAETPRYEYRSDAGPCIWFINENRTATLSVASSRRTVKADASEKVFACDTSKVTWAIVDSGVDARHEAFGVRLPDEGETGLPWYRTTRVLKTYDFTRLRGLLSVRRLRRPATGSVDAALEELLENLRSEVESGRNIDWDMVAPLLEIPHDDNYERPENHHGTHVAGILGANWPGADESQAGIWDEQGSPGLRGICPDIKLYDLRVFRADGTGDEFSIMAALQFVRHMNRHRDLSIIQGVNLSFSILHKVSNFACGQTPICLECERLIGQGVVVVAAAGNEGHHTFKTTKGLVDGYLTTSITDPGNAEHVITVGATHRNQPHSYGVSYFSSRGPTGDGRLKPDLVAPGEKIFAPVPNGRSDALDGTSMAAPHVSAAAAIIIARYPEIRGHPIRIKDILCSTATDLGRERYFQGAGMLNIFRALQSV